MKTIFPNVVNFSVIQSLVKYYKELVNMKKNFHIKTGMLTLAFAMQSVINITSVQQFLAIQPNQKNTYVLKNDLDFQNTVNSFSIRFNGIFEGSSNTIKNVKIDQLSSQGDYAVAGVFGSLCDDAIVKNLVLKNVTIDVKIGHDTRFIAMSPLIAQADMAYVQNVRATDVYVKINSSAVHLFIGGVVGLARLSNINGSFVKFDVVDEFVYRLHGGNHYLGGLVGKAGQTITINASHAMFSWSTTSVISNYIGGAVGKTVNFFSNLSSYTQTCNKVKGPDTNIGAFAGYSAKVESGNSRYLFDQVKNGVTAFPDEYKQADHIALFANSDDLVSFFLRGVVGYDDREKVKKQISDCDGCYAHSTINNTYDFEDKNITIVPKADLNNMSKYPKLDKSVWGLNTSQMMPVLVPYADQSANCNSVGKVCGINKKCSEFNDGLICDCRPGFTMVAGHCEPSACAGCKTTCELSAAGVPYCVDQGDMNCSECHTVPPNTCKFVQGVLTCPPDVGCESGYIGASCSINNQSNCTSCHPGDGVCIEINRVVECSPEADCAGRFLDDACKNCLVGYTNQSGICVPEGDNGQLVIPNPPVPCKKAGNACGEQAVCGVGLECKCLPGYVFFTGSGKCVPSSCPIIGGMMCGGLGVCKFNGSAGVCNNTAPLPCPPPLCNTGLPGLCAILQGVISCPEYNFSCLPGWSGPNCNIGNGSVEDIIQCKDCNLGNGTCLVINNLVYCSPDYSCKENFDPAKYCRECLSAFKFENGLCSAVIDGNTPKPDEQNKSNNLGLIIGVVVGVLVLLIIIIVLAIVLCKKKKDKDAKSKTLSNKSKIELLNNPTQGDVSDTTGQKGSSNKSKNTSDKLSAPDDENIFAMSRQTGVLPPVNVKPLPAVQKKKKIVQKPPSLNDEGVDSGSNQNQFGVKPLQSSLVDGTANNLGDSAIGVDQSGAQPQFQRKKRVVLKARPGAAPIVRDQNLNEQPELESNVVVKAQRAMDGTEYVNIKVGDAVGSLAAQGAAEEIETEHRQIKVLNAKKHRVGGLAPVKRTIVRRPAPQPQQDPI